MDADRRLRVLILAPFCDGTDVGESWSNYQWVSGLAREHDITLLCLRRRHRPSPASQLPGVEVVEWPDWRFPEKLERLDSMMKPGYVAWYLRSRHWIRTALRSGRRFDLIHQLAPLAIRYPSPAAGFGIPYLVGPLGGSLATPAAWARECTGASWFSRLRSLDGLRLRFDPLLRRTLSDAAAIIGVAPYVRDVLAGIPLNRFEVMSETGILEPPPPLRQRSTSADRLKLLYVGRVVRTKGLRDVIRALAHLPNSSGTTLDAIGTGDDLEACQREAEELKVTHLVRFHGRLPRAEIERFYEHADAFVFPSFREPSGNVVFEAMRHGLPVIASDRGGPGFVVNDESGFRIPTRDPSQFAREIAHSIELLRDPALRERLGRGARARVENMALWGTKLAWMSRLYGQVASASQRRNHEDYSKAPHPRSGLKRWALDSIASPAAGVQGI